MSTAPVIRITNARLFTAVDGEVIDDGTVVVEGGTITYAGPTVDAPTGSASSGSASSGSTSTGSASTGSVMVVDVDGRFVMPGMTESHVHLAYANAAPTRLNSAPVQIAMLDAVDNARVLLGSGFTSAISFGAAQGTDVPLRDAIDAGRVPGPRLLANDRDIGSTGSNADSSAPGSEGLKLIVDGPWAVRAAVRELAKKRCDVVKLFLDGEAINAYAPPGMLTYTDEEVAACIDEAHNRGLRVVTHSRSAAAVKQAVRHGADIIGHGNYLDDEAVDMLRAARDRVFVGPGIAWEITLLERGGEIGLPRAAMEAQGYQREVDETISAVKRLREAGVRVLMGGDYGLNICPHGTNAKDLQYFVELFAMTPTEALLSATRDGGAAFDPSGMVGTLEEGTHADLVVVDGDPTTDITVLQDHARLPAVMKAGVWYSGLVSSDPAYPLSLPMRPSTAQRGRKRESGV